MTNPLPRSLHRDIDLGAVAVGVVLAGLAVWIGVLPTLENEEIVRRLTGQVINSQQQLDGLQAEYRAVQNSIRRAKGELSSSQLELHGAERLASRQSELHTLLSGRGVTVEQLVVGGMARGEQLDTITLRVTGSARFPRCVALMREVRETFPDMAITAFQLVSGSRLIPGQPESENKTETVANFVFDIEWYAARSDHRSK